MSNTSATDHIPLSNVLSALGTLIGYIGTEVATDDAFYRLLWPHRGFSNFSLRNAWKVAIFMPLGGPLHKTALETMDTFFNHGLFQGELCGQMLGTAFFPDTNMTYQLFQDGLFKREASVRNGLWVKVLNRMSSRATKAIPGLQETERKMESSHTGARDRRQIFTVHYLQLSVEEEHNSRPIAKDMIVESDVGPVTPKILMAIATSEITAIAVAIAVMIIWKSAFMIIWLIPLILKLLGAFLTLARQDVLIPKPKASASIATASGNNEEVDSSTICPASKLLVSTKQGFQVICGPEEIVLQFFRHYGHPRRRRWKEIIGIALIAALGLNFPVFLVCSLIWMPVKLQCVWTIYVLYVTGVMYISRYVHGEWWATTEEQLADKFIRAEEIPSQPNILFRSANGSCLLARLTQTTHDSHSSAKAHAVKLLSASSTTTSHALKKPEEKDLLYQTAARDSAVL
ncbi:uncharacterized protein N7496_004154 [Penicillium cataractarum]|uniref:Uncharacterized protein n=1 Tax=Penicillium cataractarum TaxID=2100454 RepID=A0A9W9SNK9_9EURO|nr:uncharacterized protein N7496_004154 [Penicillium cataractarum]KAJ5381726.1 hypothetical protein N7496_004154 [Penicillium cataractarum]